MSPKFFIAFAVLLLALFFQITVGDVANVRLGFVLAALLTAAFFLNLGELILSVLFAVFALNWQPAVSPEMMIFSLIPIVVHFARAFVPLKPFLGSLFLVFVSILFFYSIFSLRFFIAHPSIVILDLLASLIYCSMAFWILKILAREREL